jgi:hypothetical protein
LLWSEIFITYSNTEPKRSCKSSIYHNSAPGRALSKRHDWFIRHGIEIRQTLIVTRIRRAGSPHPRAEFPELSSKRHSCLSISDHAFTIPDERICPQYLITESTE